MRCGMQKTAVCDDDRAFCRKMTEYIKNYLLEVEVREFNSGEALLKQQEKFDLIFLDVDMKGINGIETARRLRKKDKKVKIVYVTAYPDFVNYAFSVHAFGYLVKPITEEEIRNQLREAMDYQACEEQIQTIRLETEAGMEELAVKDIFYFEYMDRKIRAKTKKGQFTIRGSITRLGGKMEEYGFAMPHKSFSVNLYHVKAIRGYDIYMMDGSVLPLSQKKSTQFRERLSQFLTQQI